jgi:hypothetical protein
MSAQRDVLLILCVDALDRAPTNPSEYDDAEPRYYLLEGSLDADSGSLDPRMEMDRLDSQK